MRLIIFLLISVSVFAEYRVSEFDNYCGGGCDFKDKESCEAWIAKAHPTKSKDLCVDVTAEYDQKKIKKDADELTLTSIRAKLSDGSAKLEDLVEYLKIREGL